MSPVLLAAPVTILPAVAALWYLLKRYEDYFEDARVFLALVFGFFGGLLSIFMELTLFPFRHPDFVQAIGEGAALAFFVGGYAFFEAGAKIVVLGSKRFRTRKDTPYYGAALGLGFGAMMALGFVAVNLNRAEAAGIPHGVSSFIGMATVPLGAVFVHGAAGVLAGRGSAEGRLASGWAKAAFVQMPILLMFWFVWDIVGRGDYTLTFYVLPGGLSLLYGLFLMHWMRSRVLDTIVPPHIRDLVRREKRRQLRQARRDEEE